MKNVKKIVLKRYLWKRVLIAFSFFLIPGCDLPWEPGPMPTEIIDTEFEPGLNIFGILRLEKSGESASFFRVEQAYQLSDLSLENNYYLPVVDDAEVMVFDSGWGDTAVFIFGSDGMYRNLSFNPIPGRTYQLKITAPDLPALSGETMIPNLPELDESQPSESERTFTISADSTAAMYDLYLIYETGSDLERRLNTVLESITFNAKSVDPIYGRLVRIEVFAYDKNMADYLQAQVTIKPQAYNELVKTVEGGYGCFGSVTKSILDLSDKTTQVNR